MKASVFLPFLLSFSYGLYTGQLAFSIFVVALYCFGLAFIKIFLVSKDWQTESLYTLFFTIYGFLVLFSHIELIHNPEDDFFVHNDAAWSFYSGYMKFVLPCSWSDLPDRTIFNLAYSQYPLAALMMSSFGKIGIDWGIVDLRLFMRLHSVIIAALVIATMTSLLVSKHQTAKQIKSVIIPFGLFTYIFITSAIFSRDIHVCFVYCLAAYVSLKDNIRARWLWFVVLFFMALGMRPQNGIVYLIYPFAYYFNDIKKKIGNAGLIVILVVGIVVYYAFQDVFLLTQETVARYGDRASSENNAAGMFMRFYNLPFPINKISMIFYMLLEPIPVTHFIIGDGGSWLNITSILSPYVTGFAVLSGVYYLSRVRSDIRTTSSIIVAFVVFIAIVSASPDLRRGYAAIPGLFMCYALIKDNIVKSERRKIRKRVIIPVMAIQIFFIVYMYLLR